MLEATHQEGAYPVKTRVRSEEHTSELQSPCNLVCRLLLEKKIFEVARDGHRLARLVPKRQLLLEPGAREEVLVQAAGPGTYQLRTAGFDTGPQRNRYAGAVLATVRVEGAAVPPLTLPKRLLPVADLRRRITGRRPIVFSES